MVSFIVLLRKQQAPDLRATFFCDSFEIFQLVGNAFISVGVTAAISRRSWIYFNISSLIKLKSFISWFHFVSFRFI